ncbi:MAG: sulfatase-like hydrolase/transferase [Verrucomicrobiales bacterium]|nr:sulfatase-like hydrolase/transferase [Verrucomicrobiales bacterium]
MFKQASHRWTGLASWNPGTSLELWPLSFELRPPPVAPSASWPHSRSRKKRLLPLKAVLLAASLAPLAATPLAAQDTVRPNVILILADDQGSVDLGCYGARDLHTPHLDALAAQGVRFTQFYAAAPVCSPSRAGTLTGRWPVRAGVPGNCASQRGAAGALPPAEVTLAEMFRAAGYATAHIGKWHLGYTPDTLPRAQGFDHSFGHMGGCIDNCSHFFYWSGPNVHDLWRNGTEVFHAGEYFPDLMVQEAVRFMEQHRERPFFLYYALNTPHYPYQGDAKWLEHFRHVPYPRNLYAAFLAAQDERLGQLFAAVDTLGLRSGTVIVFHSDNGHSTEERAHFGGGSSGPYRGAKFSLFEGGIRLPAIVSWPGRIPQNEVRDQVAHACDLLPTLAELTGVSPPPVRLDGRSLARVLADRGATSPHAQHPLHWQVGQGPNAEWAVREGDWKLLGNVQDFGADGRSRGRVPLFLAHLGEDVGETTNRADQHPDIVARLRRLHEQHLD